MVAAATRRNAAHVADGRAVVPTCAFDEAELPPGASEVLVAFNVRLFWARESPWPTVRRLLEPTGTAYICYQLMGAAGHDDVLERLAASAGAAGMVIDRVEHADTAPFRSVCAVSR